MRMPSGSTRPPRGCRRGARGLLDPRPRSTGAHHRQPAAVRSPGRCRRRAGRRSPPCPGSWCSARRRQAHEGFSTAPSSRSGSVLDCLPPRWSSQRSGRRIAVRGAASVDRPTPDPPREGTPPPHQPKFVPHEGHGTARHGAAAAARGCQKGVGSRRLSGRPRDGRPEGMDVWCAPAPAGVPVLPWTGRRRGGTQALPAGRWTGVRQTWARGGTAPSRRARTDRASRRRCGCREPGAPAGGASAGSAAVASPSVANSRAASTAPRTMALRGERRLCRLVVSGGNMCSAE